MKILIILLIISLNISASEITKEIIKLSDLPIIVTHAETIFDTNKDAKNGIDSLIKDWQLGQIISLYSDKTENIYTTRTDKYIYSEGGEYQAKFLTDQIVIVGGFLGYNWERNARGCLTSTIADSIIFHTKSRPNHELTINLIANATYYYNDDLRPYSELQITPNNWADLLLNPFDAFFPPGTMIGAGALPPVKRYNYYYWPDENTWREIYGNRYYQPTKREGHINTASIDNYKFILLFNGSEKEVWGHGDKEIKLSIWSDVKTFKQNISKSTHILN